MKVAVVGSGISGLASAWLLRHKHDVHLFEADFRLGGHAHTVTVRENGRGIPIDTGFLVYNELTYPLLTKFFKELGVVTAASDMSLSIQVKEKNLEWSSDSLNSIFSQRKNIFKPSFHRMLLEILRFNKEAEENLKVSRTNDWTLWELLQARGYSKELCEDYLIPCGAAIWSTPEIGILDFPAETFLTFFLNHRLVQVYDRPTWRTVKDGSIEYVKKVASQIPHVFLKTPILNVERKNGKVYLRTTTSELEFDKVILATHAPITAKILKLETAQEARVLSAFKYETNHAALHSDANFMPQTKRCWSSWNVYGSLCAEKQRKVSLSYYLNRLQPLDTENDYFITLNPHRAIPDAIRAFDYAHPLFDQTAIKAQAELSTIQGRGGVYFAGAWTRYGFHEDGILSAVRAASLIEEAVPLREAIA